MSHFNDITRVGDCTYDPAREARDEEKEKWDERARIRRARVKALKDVRQARMHLGIAMSYLQDALTVAGCSGRHDLYRGIEMHRARLQREIDSLIEWQAKHDGPRLREQADVCGFMYANVPCGNAKRWHEFQGHEFRPIDETKAPR